MKKIWAAEKQCKKEEPTKNLCSLQKQLLALMLEWGEGARQRQLQSGD